MSKEAMIAFSWTPWNRSASELTAHQALQRLGNAR